MYRLKRLFRLAGERRGKFLAESTMDATGMHFGFYESPQRLRL